mgnify:CR=1 FL=1
MEEIRVNRLPIITYRYLKNNDSPFLFEGPSHSGEVSFSDMTYVREGGELPAVYDGASAETTRASASGMKYTIEIPEDVKTEITIAINCDREKRDFAGQFIFKLHKNSDLHLVWISKGRVEKSTVVISSFYDVGEEARLDVSSLETGFEDSSFYEERNVIAKENAKVFFTAAKMGAEKSVLHSYGKLSGNKSVMEEAAVYAAGGTQHLDLFYHIDHIGKETEAKIDVRGSLSDRAKKVFRGTLDFKRGCSGSVGDEGDYAMQLSPATKNISLPLLLCTEDNVVGNHASSAGQLDENTIYFLMSRGFSPEEARRIVVESLIRPLVDRMDKNLQEEILSAVREKLTAKEV